MRNALNSRCERKCVLFRSQKKKGIYPANGIATGKRDMNTNRRDFLKGTAWMGAAAVAAGCVSVSLGKRILRCETAPSYVLSVLSYVYES